MQPLTPDAVKALCELKPANATPTDRVCSGLIPRMPRFRADLELAGIPYVDGKGEYADFHSLRKTYGPMLTLAGVGQRTVKELMRHSDMRLTAKTYTDANMLPISDAMVALTRFAANKTDSQIDSQNLVRSSPAESAVVPIDAGEPKLLTAANQTFSPAVTASVPQGPKQTETARCRVRTCDLSPRRPLVTIRKWARFNGL
jgi:hypothetical protein